MDIVEYNKRAWNRAVSEKNRWTVPVSPEEIARAREGKWRVVLTPSKPVPFDWFPHREGRMDGVRLLALASGGGQQAPLFAAAGADVTVFDNSPAQLGQDRLVADREGLSLRAVEGDMKDLSAFADESFDFIFHPCSNGFVPDVRPVWKEAHRVLKRGGAMIAGFSNPVLYLVDTDLDAKGIARLRYRAPYSDLTSLSDEERKKYVDRGEPLCFGHTLADQIGGQLDAGFRLAGFYEDSWGDPNAGALNGLMDCFIATRALK